jgi:hypothetical protein
MSRRSHASAGRRRQLLPLLSPLLLTKAVSAANSTSADSEALAPGLAIVNGVCEAPCSQPGSLNAGTAAVSSSVFDLGAPMQALLVCRTHGTHGKHDAGHCVLCCPGFLVFFMQLGFISLELGYGRCVDPLQSAT